jgi:hypothetical protein
VGRAIGHSSAAKRRFGVGLPFSDAIIGPGHSIVVRTFNGDKVRITDGELNPL